MEHKSSAISGRGRTMWGAAVLLLFLTAAGAQEPSQPVLLVATPELTGPYRGTALLVIPQGDQHIGFILNRSTDLKLAALFPNHAPSAKVVDPVYFGGPEAANNIFAVVRRDPGEPSVAFFGGLFLTGNAASIDRIIEQTPNEARYYLGFVGWLPQQLADEIESGFWYVGEADASLVFEKEPETMWERLAQRLRATVTLLH